MRTYLVKDSDGAVGIIFNKLYNSDYDNFDEIKRDFDRLKPKLTNAEKEKIYKEISFASGMALSSVKQKLGDYAKDSDEDEDEDTELPEDVGFSELWGNLVRGGYFTDAELRLVSEIEGYSVETLNKCIYARYGYYSWGDLVN